MIIFVYDLPITKRTYHIILLHIEQEKIRRMVNIRRDNDERNLTITRFTGSNLFLFGSSGCAAARLHHALNKMTPAERACDFGRHPPAAHILPCLGVEIEPQANLEASARASGRHFK